MAEAALDEKPIGTNTQTNLLSLLCFSKKFGAQVASQVHIDCYAGVGRNLAQALMDYRREYAGKIPGKAGLAIILERLPLQDIQLKAAREEAARMIAALKKMNREYVAKQGLVFAEDRAFTTGLKNVIETALKPGASIAEKKRAYHDVLRNAPRAYVGSVDASDPKQALRFLDLIGGGYRMGIGPFDRFGLRLKPGELTLYMAGKNTGKSWFCIHAGYQCMLQNANVMHITLEMSEEQCMKRYLQSILAISQRDVKYARPYLEIDKAGRAISWQIKNYLPLKTFKHVRYKENRDDRKYKLKPFEPWIRGRHKHLVPQLKRLRIKGFPTGSLTLVELENHLDAEAALSGFQPHVLIVDYPDLMKVETRDFRLNLGEIITGLRGIAQSRKLALVCPTQVNRVGMGAKKVRSTHVAESINKIFTADNVLTYTQTETERSLHLARLVLEHARDDEVGMEVVIGQSYAIGKYVVDAALMGDKFRTKLDDTLAAEQRVEYDTEDDAVDGFRM